MAHEDRTRTDVRDEEKRTDHDIPTATDHELETLHSVEWTTTQDRLRRLRIVDDPEAITTRLMRVEEVFESTAEGWRVVGREPVSRVVWDGEEVDLPAYRQPEEPEAGTEVQD